MYIWNKCRKAYCPLQTNLHQYLLRVGNGSKVDRNGRRSGRPTNFCWDDATWPSRSGSLYNCTYFIIDWSSWCPVFYGSSRISALISCRPERSHSRDEISHISLWQYTYGQWRRHEFESGGTGPQRKWRKRKFFGRTPALFWGLKLQLVVLVSAFVMVSTVWSVSCLLFFYSRCPLVPSHL